MRRARQTRYRRTRRRRRTEVASKITACSTRAAGHNYIQDRCRFVQARALRSVAHSATSFRDDMWTTFRMDHDNRDCKLHTLTHVLQCHDPKRLMKYSKPHPPFIFQISSTHPRCSYAPPLEAGEKGSRPLAVSLAPQGGRTADTSGGTSI